MSHFEKIAFVLALSIAAMGCVAPSGDDSVDDERADQDALQGDLQNQVFAQGGFQKGGFQKGGFQKGGFQKGLQKDTGKGGGYFGKVPPQ